MEGEIDSEARDVQEKGKKRKLKTPLQLEALEKFYNEYRYPTESMKVEVAERIGLTEKQVSGWFCHRRLKDKKVLHDEAYVNGKHDRSSSVIQDRGSGLRQDSCGSSKRVDSRQFEMREVESQRSYSKDNKHVGLTFEPKKQRAGDSSETDNSSSGTSSPVQDRICAQMESMYCNRTSRFPALHRRATQSNVGFGMRPHNGPSGYLKVKGDIANSAIAAVKMQLGKFYREDGPPLGIDFQPFPPGAFGSQLMDPVNESYDTRDMLHSKALIVPSRHIQPLQKQSCKGDGEYPKLMHHYANRNQYVDRSPRARPSFLDNNFRKEEDPRDPASMKFEKVGREGDADAHTKLTLDWYPCGTPSTAQPMTVGVTSSDEGTDETEASVD